MNIKKFFKIEVLIVISALIIGLIFNFIPYNKYLITEDIRQVVYWAYQFRDQDLFKNDLLTQYAKNYEPWGYFFVYYLSVLFIDPLIATKILAVFIYAISSLYIFKLIKLIANKALALLAAAIYLTSSLPTAALPRNFSVMFLIIFLYYLTKKAYFKTGLVLTLQALFYPMVCVLSLITYFLTFFKLRAKKSYFVLPIKKVKFFILAGFFCTLILGTKYLFSYNPAIGFPVNRKQIEKDYASYTFGSRFLVLPVPSLTRTIINNTNYPKIIHLNYDRLLPSGLKTIKPVFVFFAFTLILLIASQKLSLPMEIPALYFAGIIAFKIADIFLVKLFLPKRYPERAVPLVIFVIFTSFIGFLIEKVKNIKIKKRLYGFLIIFFLLDFILHFKIIRLNSFSDFSSFAPLYEYLKTLPKNTLLAGPPKLMDSIPTFSQRKVFINYELSHAIYDNYWSTIKKRTFDFYDAYYSATPSSIYKFCQNNGIDYLVVDNYDFAKDYLAKTYRYIEPFNSYIYNLSDPEKSNNFVLANIPEKDKLFSNDGIFVINKNIFNLE